MKLAIGFITYNESSGPYLPYFLTSLKEALEFAGLEDSLTLSFENSNLDFFDNKKIISDFLIANPNFNYQELGGTGENLGFAKAYNLMIDRAISLGVEYFLVVNPDILFSPESIWLLLEPLLKNKNLASSSPRIMSWNFEKLKRHSLIDSFGISLTSGLRFFDIDQGLEYDEENREKYLKLGSKILAPSGAGGIFRIQSLKKVAEKREGRNQYFDERFFMYKEDCDLGYRLKLKNLKSVFVFDSIIYHDRTTKSLGSGIANLIKGRFKKSRLSRAWSFRNQHFLFIKHFKTEKLYSKFKIIIKSLQFFVFALIFEQFLLKEYRNIYNFWRKS